MSEQSKILFISRADDHRCYALTDVWMREGRSRSGRIIFPRRKFMDSSADPIYLFNRAV